jgi:hypothetical protein
MIFPDGPAPRPAWSEECPGNPPIYEAVGT